MRELLTSLCCGGLLFVLMVMASPAVSMDQQMRVASYCTKHFSRLERKHGIPKYLMLAVSATETGRWSKAAGMLLPWPWTINAEGKGQFFATKHEAVTAVQRLREQGVRSIDVGCMQVNLHHHGHAFTSINQAFDPAYNTAYAAKFLKQNYQETRSWRKATAAYHSRTRQRGQNYFAKVRKNWRNALANIRADAGLTTIVRGGEAVELALLSPASGEGISLVNTRKKKKKSSSAKRAGRSMKIIQVKPREPNGNDGSEVLVVRPKVKRNAPAKTSVMPAQQPRSAPAIPRVAKVAKAQFPSVRQEMNFVTATSASGVRTVRTASSAAQPPVSSRKKGPNFIFY